MKMKKLVLTWSVFFCVFLISLGVSAEVNPVSDVTSEALLTHPNSAEAATPTDAIAQTASTTTSKIDHQEGFVWLSGGAWGSDNNSSYGRNYRDLENRVSISKLNLRYFNDSNLEYHIGARDLGTLNSRFYGVLYLQDRFKLDFDGGRISHYMLRSKGFQTQREWVDLTALQDVHPFLTLSLTYEGYERDGIHRYNPQDQSYYLMGFGVNYLRGPNSGYAYHRKGTFQHPTLGYDEFSNGFMVGRNFRGDRDHAMVSYDRTDLRSDQSHDSRLEQHFLSGVYSTNPNKDWTFRGGFRGNVRDNRTESIYGEDIFERGASLDAVYHGFKKVRAKARISAHNVDRYARSGRSRLPDTEDFSGEFRLSNKGKCDWNWDFHFKYTDRNGSSFYHNNPSEHAVRTSALNVMDYFPSNSFTRSKTAFSCSRSFNKEKLVLSANLQRDWTDYELGSTMGVDDIRFDTAMINLLWYANSKLTLGLGAGGTVSEMNAVTNIWHNWVQRTTGDNFVSRDDVYNFNLGYNLNSRTLFTADFMVTRGYSDGLVYPNRFGEFDQSYDVEYRLSKDSRVGLRYSDLQYVERVYSQEDGRIRRIDVDYRLLF